MIIHINHDNSISTHLEVVKQIEKSNTHCYGPRTGGQNRAARAQGGSSPGQGRCRQDAAKRSAPALGALSCVRFAFHLSSMLN
uniref:Uncharacterized protein n=1 Tax=Arundo donax TaxID=35708 RepID=A0A0A8YID4_ARUDO